jgi:hypothetical protein
LDKNLNSLENIKYHYETIPKFNQEIVDSEAKLIPLINIYLTVLFLGFGQALL